MLFGEKIIVGQFEQKHIIYIITTITIIGIIFYIMYLFKYMTESSKIKIVKKDYETLDIHKLESYNIDQCIEKYKNNYLSDFYIASSANSFLVGNQKYDYTNIEMIKNCIIMGARYIELEILCDSLDINAKPIVTTGTELGQWQTSLNNINFEEACQVISDFAFNEEVKTYQLPFFVYLKLKVNNNPFVLDKMANVIKKYFPSKQEKKLEIGNRILNEINPANTKICTLFNQIIIWSDPVSTEGYDKIQLKGINNYQSVINNYPPNRMHYTELESNAKEISDRQKTPEEKRRKLDKLSEFNKNNLTIVYPNKEESESISYDPEESWSYGCQFVAINYQLNDNNRLTYFNKFKTDSIDLKPSVLRKDIKTISGKDIDNLIPNEKDTKDVSRKNMQVLYKNTPIYLRPFNDSTKVITINTNNNNEIIVKTKNDSELDIIDGFLIKPSLVKPSDPYFISLESIRYPNFYLSFNNSGFSIYDLRTKKFDNDIKEFNKNASFILKQGLVSTRGSSIGSENTSTMITFYIQSEENNVMIYNSTADAITFKEDDGQNYEIATQGTFNMYKLPVKQTFTIRQADSKYVHSENKLLVKNKMTLDKNGIFDFISEKLLNLNIELNPLSNNIHIKDFKGNYWSVDNKGNLTANEKNPSKKTRFYLKEKGPNTQIFYSKGSNDLPLFVQSDGVLRLAFENEKNHSKTLFIIGNSFTKKKE